MRDFRFAVPCALVFLFLFPVLCRAADGAPEFRVEARTGFAGPADFDHRGGSVSVARGGVSVIMDRFKLDYDLRSYRWGGSGDLPLGGGADEPWDSLHSLSVSVRGGGPLGGDWGWFWTAGAGTAWEKEMDGALSVSAGGGLSRTLAPDLGLRLGGMASLGPMGWKMLPMASLTWRAGAEQGFSAGLGLPETHVAYRFGPIWALRLAGTWEGGVWRLADDSPVERKGYLRESGVRTGLYVQWTPLEGLDLRFGPEWTFARSMSVYNEDGEKRNSYGLGSALGASLRLGYRF